jgi:hypothetical protein
MSVAGTIPTELGLMTNLETLLLFDTSLTGSIPSELGLLTNSSELLLLGSMCFDVQHVHDLTVCYPIVSLF